MLKVIEKTNVNLVDLLDMERGQFGIVRKSDQKSSVGTIVYKSFCLENPYVNLSDGSYWSNIGEEYRGDWLVEVFGNVTIIMGE